jgi:outer membrane protein OmpA-like peptidoglycan-associated protein
LASCGNKKKLARQHNDLLDTYQTLKDDLPKAGVTMTGEQVAVIFPEAILFSFDSATVRPEYYTAFEKMAMVFNKYPRTNILITGYTDTIGTEQYNNALGKRRAEAAKGLLIQYGVKPRRIYSWGLGTKDPVGDNNTMEGRQQNRRVEFVILYDYNAKVKVN